MNSMTKKTLALVLSLALVALVGCSTGSSTAPASSAAPAPASSAAPAPGSSGPSEPEANPVGHSWKPYDENGQIKRTDRDANGENGVVSTGKVEATQVGIDIIKAGGNAIDAAVAVGFALGVCEPQSSGLGGGGFMMIRAADGGGTTFIDFRETAPAKAVPEMWEVGPDGKVVDNAKRIGGKAVGTPGEVKGLLHALENYGTMTREQVMNPAIEMATNGYEVSAVLNSDIKNSFDFINKYPATGAIYLKDGFPYEIGDTIKNLDLAKTLTLIRDNGESAFYTGPVAEAMVKSVQDAGGYLSMEDLAGFEIEEHEALTGTYRDSYEIITVAPPSTGGAHIIQILNILENYDMSALEVNSTEYLHLFSEAIKMAFADRAEHMGDPKFVDVPIQGVINKEYAKLLAGQIDLKAAKDYSAGDPWPYESEQTTSFSIMDKEGNMVAVTKTVNGVFASGVVAEGTGVLMNNEMDDFDLGAGKPNSIAGNKVPLSSMSPTLILKDGKPFMSIGAPGATRIITGVAQVISKVIDHDMDIQDAIDSARIHDSFGDLVIETRVAPEVVKELEAMGHKVTYEEEWFGYPCVQAVVMLEDGTLRGGADPRRDGKALGY